MSPTSTNREVGPRGAPEQAVYLGCAALLFSFAFVVIAAGIWLLAQASLAFGLVA